MLKIKEYKSRKNKRITFEIYVEQSDGLCVGEMGGRPRATSSNLYEYNPSGVMRDAQTGEMNYCRLSFVFSGNQVVVRENRCDDFHGTRCNFEGKYIRVKR